MPRPKGKRETQCVECGAVFVDEEAFDRHFKHDVSGLIPIDKGEYTVYAVEEDPIPRITIDW